MNFKTIAIALPNKYKKVIKPKVFASYLRDFLTITLILIAMFQLQVLVLLNGIYKESVLKQQFYAKDFIYWESVSGQFPNIPDILYNTSLSAFNAGHKIEALQYLEKALNIDPLFEKAYDLKKEISSI